MSFNIALSGLKASDTQLRATGNNIANSSSVAFKSSSVEFSDVYSSTAGGSVVGSGVKLRSVLQNFSQGNISTDSNALSMAVDGAGFFVVNDGSSISYTRNGKFGVDSSGFIVNSAGHRLQGLQADTSGMITSVTGDLAVNTSSLAPVATTSIDASFNLNANSEEPTGLWVGSPNFNSPSPATNSYNDSTSTSIIDSLGNSHNLSIYLLKDGDSTKHMGCTRPN